MQRSFYYIKAVLSKRDSISAPSTLKPIVDFIKPRSRHVLQTRYPGYITKPRSRHVLQTRYPGYITKTRSALRYQALSPSRLQAIYTHLALSRTHL